MKYGSVVVTLSGGQDSCTTFAWARANKETVHTLSFDYGQRHSVELDCAQALARKYGVPHTILSIQAFKELGAAGLTNNSIKLVDDAAGTGNDHAERVGLPSSFVPGRNIIFLGLAAAYAVQHGLGGVVTGICGMDEAGYPDCRPLFAQSLEQTISLGMGTPVKLDAPLLHLDKGETFTLAHTLGILDEVVFETHTCYEGDHTHLHDWGFGCGQCGACRTREAGWNQFALRHPQSVAEHLHGARARYRAGIG